MDLFIDWSFLAYFYKCRPMEKMADFHNWLPHAWVDPGTKFFYCWTMQYIDQYIGLFLPPKTRLGQCIGLCNTEYQLIIRSRYVLCESVRPFH